MLHSSLILALLTSAATASPLSPRSPPTASEFTVSFSIPYDSTTLFLSANAEFNSSSSSSTTPSVILVGKSLSSSPGTPAYLNGTSPNAALIFDLTNQTNSAKALYGATVPNLGDAYGSSADVTAILGYEDANWGVNNGTIFHRLYSGAENFFACSDVVNGETAWVLKFGVYNENDQPPAGCTYTTVRQNFNVPGGAQGSAV